MGDVSAADGNSGGVVSWVSSPSSSSSRMFSAEPGRLCSVFVPTSGRRRRRRCQRCNRKPPLSARARNSSNSSSNMAAVVSRSSVSVMRRNDARWGGEPSLSDGWLLVSTTQSRRQSWRLRLTVFDSKTHFRRLPMLCVTSIHASCFRGGPQSSARSDWSSVGLSCLQHAASGPQSASVVVSTQRVVLSRPQLSSARSEWSSVGLSCRQHTASGPQSASVVVSTQRVVLSRPQLSSAHSEWSSVGLSCRQHAASGPQLASVVVSTERVVLSRPQLSSARSEWSSVGLSCRQHGASGPQSALSIVTSWGRTAQ